jgi:hypothetical protein
MSAATLTEKELDHLLFDLLAKLEKHGVAIDDSFIQRVEQCVIGHKVSNMSREELLAAKGGNA